MSLTASGLFTPHTLPFGLHRDHAGVHRPEMDKHLFLSVIPPYTSSIDLSRSPS